MNHMPRDVPEITPGTFIVGDLYVDVGQQRVTRAGSDIALPNLSFQLLLALVRAAPNVLSRGVRSRGYRLIDSVCRATEGARLPNLPTPIPEGSPRAAEFPVPPIPIDAHPPELPTSRSRLGRWAALSVLTAGLLIAATIGVRWAARLRALSSYRLRCGDLVTY